MVSLCSAVTVSYRFSKKRCGCKPIDYLLHRYCYGHFCRHGPYDCLDWVRFVTFNAIDLQEAASNTDATTTMEYGYGLFKASATDGASNNTISNCVITLNRVNTTAPTTGPAFQGSNGIALLVCAQLLMQTTITVTATSGASSNNKFYSNTIQNVNNGICMSGFADE